MIEGLIQEVEYENAAAPLRYIVKKNGREVVPDAAPTITIYDPSGDELVSATSMTAVTPATGERGYLDFDALTANFTLGETLTGGTSSATGRIEEIRVAGTAGTLALSNMQGTFTNNETITDSASGSATADGTGYTCEYVYALNASSTDTYELAESYYGQIIYLISSVTYNDWLYFDVCLHTFMEPIITSQLIDLLHPDWSQWNPRGENADWTTAIGQAHARLSRLIRSLGNRPACIIKREELYDIELAFVEEEIAKRITSMEATERDFWIKNAGSAWAKRGEFAYNTDDTHDIDEDVKVFSSGFTT